MKQIERKFPLYLAKPAQRALAGKGIAKIFDLTKFTKSEIKSLHGIGPNAFQKFHQEMLDLGISFKPEKYRHDN
ncbi:MAG: hypothetical protein R2813_03800 [Flavobacteriales bacterium]